MARATNLCWVFALIDDFDRNDFMLDRLIRWWSLFSESGILWRQIMFLLSIGMAGGLHRLCMKSFQLKFKFENKKILNDVNEHLLEKCNRRDGSDESVTFALMPHMRHTYYALHEHVVFVVFRLLKKHQHCCKMKLIH